MEKIKVIEYIGSLNDGGAETLVKNYCLLLNKEIFDVKVLVTAPGAETATAKALRENGIEVLYIYPRLNLTSKITNKFFKKTYVPKRLLKILREEKCNVLHIHLNLLWSVAPIAESVSEIGIKMVYSCHSNPKQFFSGKRTAEYYAAKEIMAHCALQMIALHDEMAKEINELFNITNCCVIKNGIDLSKYKVDKNLRVDFRHVLGIPTDAFVLGHVGRFSNEKNHFFIVEVFNALRNRVPNAFLLLVGDGDLKSEISGELKKRGLDGCFLILSNRSDIPDLLSTMDAFIFPSRFEGFGIALVEAQAAGLRCVISEAIPSAAVVSDCTVRCSLDAPVSEWVNKLLSDERNDQHDDIADYDICIEIKKLEKVYGYGEI